MIWVGLATVMGVGLRFVQVPDFMLPIAVGIAVAAAVVLVLRLASPAAQPETAPPHAPCSKPSRPRRGGCPAPKPRRIRAPAWPQWPGGPTPTPSPAKGRAGKADRIYQVC
jgi:hypothetical protein